MYKLDKNGNEMYNKRKMFGYNSEHDEIYAKDVKGNEIYPGYSLARDRFRNFYYAKDLYNNEYYPTRKKRDVMFTGSDGRAFVARLQSSHESLPTTPFYVLTESTKTGKDERNHVYHKEDVLGNNIYTTDPKLGRKFKAFDLTLFSVVCLGNLPILVGLILILAL